MNSFISHLLALAIFSCIASSFQLANSNQSTTSALEHAGASNHTPLVRYPVENGQDAKKEQCKTAWSPLVVCDKGCELCSAENGTMLKCLIEMNTPISVLRVVEEAENFLRVVSRVDIGTDVIGIDLDSFASPDLKFASCPELIDYTAAPNNKMMFCLRTDANDTENAPGMPGPLAFDSLPLGILGEKGSRQLEQLSTPRRVEVMQNSGVTMFLPLSFTLTQNSVNSTFSGVNPAGILKVEGDQVPTCKPKKM